MCSTLNLDIWTPPFHLLQGRPAPHHWKLKNLAQLAERVARACGARTVLDFLLSANPVSAPERLRFALVLQLCCNCWTL